MNGKYNSFFSQNQRIVAAKLCFLVFAVKMLISATPMFVNALDKDTILQIVLQLEIENTAKNTNSNNEDLHEHSVKIFKPDSVDLENFGLLSFEAEKERRYLKNEKDRCFFESSVPTPPPNC